jgi:TDG/mug DNA glycosylase family protein
VAGSQTLIEKIKKFKPKIAVFNGKGIYEVFSSQKSFPLGKQAEKLEGTDTVSRVASFAVNALHVRLPYL